MLSENRLKELRAIVKKEYPNWKPEGNGGATFTKDDFPCSMSYVPQFSRIFGGCCGAGAIREISGLYYIGKYTEVQKALFALLLHHSKFPGLFLACTVNQSSHHLCDEDKTLQFCGFHPIIKVMNKAHGPNYLTVWILNTGEPGVQIDGETFVCSLWGQNVGREGEAVEPQAEPLSPIPAKKKAK